MSTNWGSNTVHTLYATYEAAASVAVNNVKADTEGYHFNVVRHGSKWAVEMLDTDCSFMAFL